MATEAQEAAPDCAQPMKRKEEWAESYIAYVAHSEESQECSLDPSGGKEAVFEIVRSVLGICFKPLTSCDYKIQSLGRALSWFIMLIAYPQPLLLSTRIQNGLTEDSQTVTARSYYLKGTREKQQQYHVNEVKLKQFPSVPHIPLVRRTLPTSDLLNSLLAYQLVSKTIIFPSHYFHA
ncbi:uncharacterized protein BDR25DRAFT_353660 [Lindgomyces ingoldianus]|uniref:Uncharacterized protein n=1 Tax=Lindgomyces ingoldianus TaxID=673940 RepID=A0ACB6R2F7_9PLEO|nr:uncharacterized protein BDR25DRAFT_353660 [Lindgomyces ingoldianus]KAF2472626.1 hypothetical protein BDR25DRAFT_353660 [Lindgomyces ingoldianus]